MSHHHQRTTVGIKTAERGRKKTAERGWKKTGDREEKEKEKEKSFRNQLLKIFKLDIHKNNIILSIEILYACSLSKKLSFDILKV